MQKKHYLVLILLATATLAPNMAFSMFSCCNKSSVHVLDHGVSHGPVFVPAAPTVPAAPAPAAPVPQLPLVDITHTEAQPAPRRSGTNVLVPQLPLAATDATGSEDSSRATRASSTHTRHATPAAPRREQARVSFASPVAAAFASPLAAPFGSPASASSVDSPSGFVSPATLRRRQQRSKSQVQRLGRHDWADSPSSRRRAKSVSEPRRKGHMEELVVADIGELATSPVYATSGGGSGAAGDTGSHPGTRIAQYAVNEAEAKETDLEIFEKRGKEVVIFIKRKISTLTEETLKAQLDLILEEAQKILEIETGTANAQFAKFDVTTITGARGCLDSGSLSFSEIIKVLKATYAMHYADVLKEHAKLNFRDFEHYYC